MKTNKTAVVIAATASLALLFGCMSNRCLTVQDSTGARVILPQPVVRNNSVLVFSCADIFHPNAAIADTVAKVAGGLYPDIFKKNKAGH